MRSRRARQKNHSAPILDAIDGPFSFQFPQTTGHLSKSVLAAATLPVYCVQGCECPQLEVKESSLMFAALELARLAYPQLAIPQSLRVDEQV